jgi:outer membrane protein OmpA-like peptidoglycan-associated protein
MATSLIDLAKSYLTSEVMHRISGELGESPERTEKAIEAGIPSILAGLLNTVSSSGVSRLFEMLKQGPSELSHLGGLDSVLANPASLMSGASVDTLIKYGQTILSFLFGGKLNSIVDLITKTSGVKASSASSLLGMLAPLLMGVLRKETTSEGLSLAGLTKLLMDQKSSIAKLAPAGLSSVLGLKSLSDLGSVADSVRLAGTGAATEVGRAASAAASEGSAFLRWAAPLALLAAVLCGLWYLFSGRGEQPQNADAAPNLAQVTRPVTDAARKNVERVSEGIKDTRNTLTEGGRAIVETAKRMVSVTLPGNLMIELPETSYLQGIVKSLTDSAGTSLPKSTVAEDLSFEGNTAKLTPESATATTRLATVLKAFGTAKLKIEGHTDNLGDPAANKQSSLERATAVKDALVKVGAPADRITVEGVGADRPVASNDTEEGRAKNRRIELSIVAK